ncbi:MAG TPA: acyltransferase [Longimicrobiales bacterium]|nr:acyltransferase [Longimicrobiales bacterium]
MAFLPLRKADLPETAERAYTAWLDGIAAELADPSCDRDELCRRVLTEIYYPQLAGTDPGDLPEGARIALMQMDPRNITLEPEYYAEIDRDRYARVKPLIWLWEMFDKSVLGENVVLGVRFRRILARHIFRRCGRNFKAFHFVKLSFGYNTEVGDDVIIHRHVLLDDRGGIRLGDRTSIADYANIYSHTHALHDGRDVETPAVIIGRGVRITYHATVLAGVQMADDSMLGALAVATRDIASGDIALGIPAEPKLRKPPPDQRPVLPPSSDPLVDAPD